MRPIILVFSAMQTILLGSGVAAGAEGASQIVNFYKLCGGFFGLQGDYVSIVASLFSILLCSILGLLYKSMVQRKLSSGEPSAGVSLVFFLESALDVVYGITKDTCGPKYLSFLPIMAGFFVFILVSNLSGLVPGFPPTTEYFHTNLGMGLVAFFLYNGAGVREHGASYIKQFTGPVALLAPLFIVIELVSHSVRPLSLAFRLLANIFCDHLLLGVFSGLVPLVLPSLFLMFGLLVAGVQSFVFTLLTGVYVNMAISHDH